ncbi:MULTISPECIES: cobyric acid synthase [Jonquetella]|uniref:cobyric acid synthase n=1 Tax=Jonquetella TaxID=428711 RepID=UPI0003AE4BE6|nr:MULTISPECIES: cobyric acid synthase [Jonquetella]ERL23413.1 CobQ/CobB/MinD/ParA nucleotide binding domain protein [Jonquetella sp. BV3C21]
MGFLSKCVMVQGCSSSVGKSVLTAGLCRLYARRGFRVAPFKAQNMAFPAYLPDGRAIAGSVVTQAEAACREPESDMNPILLRVAGEGVSEVFVQGRSIGLIPGHQYQADKGKFRPKVEESWRRLLASNDVVVIEGAGSPAEINLKKDDLVNMGMAKMAGAPVLLVGDIDRGGVFAALAGTLLLLDPEERDLVKGMVINKFRGDLSLLEPGLAMIENITGKPVLGVVRYFRSGLPEEDSLEVPAAPLTAEERNERYDRLADLLESSLDVAKLDQIVGVAR